MIYTSIILLVISNAVSLRRDKSIYSVKYGILNNFILASRYLILGLTYCIILQANTIVYGDFSAVMLYQLINISSASLLIFVLFGNLIYTNHLLSDISSKFISIKYLILIITLISSRIFIFILSMLGWSFLTNNNIILHSIFTMLLLFLLIDACNNNLFKSKRSTTIFAMLSKSSVKCVLGSFPEEFIILWNHIRSINYSVVMNMLPHPTLPHIVVSDGTLAAKTHNAEFLRRQATQVTSSTTNVRKHINELISLQEGRQRDIDRGLPLDHWEGKILDCKEVIRLSSNSLADRLLEREFYVNTIKLDPQGSMDHRNISTLPASKLMLDRARALLSN